MKKPLCSVCFSGVNHRGCVRENNEDCMLFFNKVFYDRQEVWINSREQLTAGWICAVADGIGGSLAGEIASQYVLGKLSRIRNHSLSHIEKTLINLNRELIKMGNTKPALHGLGTTVAGIDFDGESIIGFNVGDARLYRLVDNKLKQISIDDNLAGIFKKQGFEVNGLYKAYFSHTLTQSIGGSDILNEISPHLFVIKPGKTERFLLCTDGLTNMVSNEEIEDVIQKNPITEDVVKKLLNSAINAGGKDNITIAYIEIQLLEQL